MQAIDAVQLTSKQLKKRIRNRKHKQKKRNRNKINLLAMTDDERTEFFKIREEKMRLNKGWILLLPTEITHIICSLLRTVDIMNLAICCKLLNSYINKNEFWRMHYINTYNDKFNKDNEGKWKILYIEKYIEMKSTQNKLNWVIDGDYPKLIPDVLNFKKFMLTPHDPNTYLQNAILKTNALEMLRILFDHWNIQKHKDQLLYTACEKGLVNICRFLLKTGASTEYVTGNGMVPLLIAALNGKLDICKVLIEEAGANIEKQYPGGATALYCAAQNGHHEVITYLVSKKANVETKHSSMTPLHTAIDRGHLEAVRALLKAGAKTNVAGISTGMMPLWGACNKGLTDIVKLLLEHDADQTIMHLDQTPLYIAALNGFDKIVELLCNDPRVKIDQEYGQKTPLYVACENGHYKVAVTLVENGANINYKGISNRTPLYIACIKNNPDIVHLLCHKGADIDKKITDIAQDGCKRVLNFYKGVREHNIPKDDFTSMMNFYKTMIEST